MHIRRSQALSAASDPLKSFKVKFSYLPLTTEALSTINYNPGAMQKVNNPYFLCPTHNKPLRVQVVVISFLHPVNNIELVVNHLP